MSDSIHEKAPKGPNFLLVVILSCVTILLVLLAVLFVLKKDKKLEPHGPNPTPNSRLTSPSSTSLQV